MVYTYEQLREAYILGINNGNKEDFRELLFSFQQTKKQKNTCPYCKETTNHYCEQCAEYIEENELL